MSAVVVSEAYRKRWTIEGGFLDLTTTLDCEINTLCYPRAALFVFCVAVMAYNLQSAIKGVMRSEHGAEKVENDLSRYFMSGEIGQVYRGMMVALPPEEWAIFRHMSLDGVCRLPQEIGRQRRFRTLSQSTPGTQESKAQAHITTPSIPMSPSPSSYSPENSRRPADIYTWHAPWKGCWVALATQSWSPITYCWRSQLRLTLWAALPRHHGPI